MPFAIEPSTEIQTRGEFARLCNARNIFRAVEVGTDQGVFAGRFLDEWDRRGLLFCIDPWENYQEMLWDRDMDMFLAVSSLARHAGRIRFIREWSPRAIEYLPAQFSVEFVYIDAAHDYSSVKADLAAWWDRLYSEGPTILAGHDFDDEHADVKRAVTEFAREHDVIVRLTRDADSAASWYIYRNEPRQLCVFRT